MTPQEHTYNADVTSQDGAGASAGDEDSEYVARVMAKLSTSSGAQRKPATSAAAGASKMASRKTPADDDNELERWLNEDTTTSSFGNSKTTKTSKKAKDKTEKKAKSETGKPAVSMDLIDLGDAGATEGAEGEGWEDSGWAEVDDGWESLELESKAK